MTRELSGSANDCPWVWRWLSRAGWTGPLHSRRRACRHAANAVRGSAIGEAGGSMDCTAASGAAASAAVCSRMAPVPLAASFFASAGLAALAEGTVWSLSSAFFLLGDAPFSRDSACSGSARWAAFSSI